MVRKEYTGNASDITKEEEILYHVSLNWTIFDTDFKKVMQLIKEINIVLPADDWI